MSPKLIGHKKSDTPAHGYLKTGFYSMDRAFNPNGEALGIPYGTLWEIYGPPASAKSTVSYSLASMLSVHLNTGWCLMDTEDAYTPEYVSAIGENLGMGENQPIAIIEKVYHEEKLDQILDWMHNGDIGVGVIDSIGMIGSRGEFDGKLGEANMGQRGKMMYQWVRKFFFFKNPNYEYIPTHSTVFMINHMTDNLSPFGGPVRPGGKGKDYGAGVRVLLGQEERFDDGSLHIKGTVKKLRWEGGGFGNTFHFVTKVGTGMHKGLSAIFDLRALKAIKIHKGVITATVGGTKEKLPHKLSYYRTTENEQDFEVFYNLLEKVETEGVTKGDEDESE